MLSKKAIKRIYLLIHDLNCGDEIYWGSYHDLKLEEEVFAELQKQLKDEEIKKFFDKNYVSNNGLGDEYSNEFLQRYNRDEQQWKKNSMINTNPAYRLEINASKTVKEEFELRIYNSVGNKYFAFLVWQNGKLVASPDMETVKDCQDWGNKIILESFDSIDSVEVVDDIFTD